MSRSARNLLALAALTVAGTAALAAGDVGQTAKQGTNWTAIVMFVAFVGLTLWITKWAAGAPSRRPTSTPPAAASPASRTAWP